MRIDHVALYCIDLEAMRDFFVKYFSCSSNRLYHNQRTGLRTYILSFPDGEARLEIMARPEVTGVSLEQYRAGFIHISVSVGSSDAVDGKTSQLVRAGYECVSGPRITGDGYYESCVIGPEGIMVEITM